jgi:hypothetical protein
MLDGNNRATRCLELLSWRGGQFEDLLLFAATAEMLFTGVFSGTPSLQPNSTQFNRFIRVITSARNQTTNTAHAARLTGGQGSGATVAGNTSFNQFFGCLFRCYNADALVLEDSDNNAFYGVQAGHDTGTGYSLVLSSADQDSSGSVLSGRHARVNQFYGCEFKDGVYARAGQTGNSSSDSNQFYGLNYSNGAPPITYETATGGSAPASARVFSSSAAELLNATKIAVGDTTANTATARTNLSTESVRIKNASSNHLVLASGDGLSTWGVNIDNATGDFRVTRTAGTGRALIGGGPQVDIITATGAGTWTKPTGAVRHRVVVAAGGGGGGSGRRGAAASVRCGGGGGAGGQIVFGDFLASDLGATESYIVGAGGAGGAAVTADSTDGNAGSTGTQSYFGSNTNRWLSALGGPGGSGGTATTGAGGAASFSGGSVGQSASTSGAAPASSPASVRPTNISGAGGAAGGGITSGDATSAGGAGSFLASGSQTAPTAGQPDGGTAAQNGNASRTPTLSGGGAAGGGSSKTTAAGAGGAGGKASGGGGGGASANTFASGAGGAGGDGFIVVITYFS